MLPKQIQIKFADLRQLRLNWHKRCLLHIRKKNKYTNLKIKLKHSLIILIFSGLFLSCFQFTINQLTKNSKVNNIELSLKDIDNNKEDNAAETKKLELEDDYFFSEFLYGFTELSTNKLTPFFKQSLQNSSPVISIKTPPPKFK